MPRPYADAPRLPEGDRIEVGSIVQGEWIELELGPGRGGFLMERAALEPQAALIGLEIRRKWAAVVDGRLAERGLGARARVFAEDARFALPRLAPDASVRRVFVHFPDPWWKKRHAKRLLVQGGFLDQLARLLQPDGELFMQTDVEDRAAGYEELAARDNRLRRRRRRRGLATPRGEPLRRAQSARAARDRLIGCIAQSPTGCCHPRPKAEGPHGDVDRGGVGSFASLRMTMPPRGRCTNVLEDSLRPARARLRATAKHDADRAARVVHGERHGLGGVLEPLRRHGDDAWHSRCPRCRTSRAWSRSSVRR